MTGWAHLQLACPLCVGHDWSDLGHMLCAAFPPLGWMLPVCTPCLHSQLTHPLPVAGPNKGRPQNREQPPFKLSHVQTPAGTEIPGGVCTRTGTHQGLCSRISPLSRPWLSVAPLSLPSASNCLLSPALLLVENLQFVSLRVGYFFL